jgi:NADH-quinone oxidoreductase subunit L
VLAYSTVSQLGYMFLACGVGAFANGMFHVTTHAFFKALLFLGAGSVIHALGGEQDMRKMGGLAKKVPITYWTMVAAWLAIAGVFPFAGFWSKDAILESALHFEAYPQLGPVLYGAGLVTALMTAFYMTRLMAKTFWTAQRYNEAELGAHGHGGDGHEFHVHESPKSMWIPLAILAVLSVFGGFLNVPGRETFTGFLSASTATVTEHAGEANGIGASVVVLGLIGVAVAVLGILWAWGGYKRRSQTGDLLTADQKAASPMYRGSLNLWYIDQTFNAIFIRGGGKYANALWQWIDRGLIDGTVNGLAAATAVLSEGFRRVQTGYIRAYAMTMLIGVVLVVVSLLMGLGR